MQRQTYSGGKQEQEEELEQELEQEQEQEHSEENEEIENSKLFSSDDETQTELLEHSQQSAIIPLMIKLGYTADPGGVCFGYSMMAMQMVQSGQLDKLLTILDQITSFSSDELTNIINTAKDELKKLRKEFNLLKAKTNISQLKANTLTDFFAHEDNQNLKKQRKEEVELSDESIEDITEEIEKKLQKLLEKHDEHKEIFNLLAFLDGIDFYQYGRVLQREPGQKKRLVKKNIKLMLPEDLQQKGIKIKQPFSFFALPTEENAIQVFNQLTTAINESTLQGPVSIVWNRIDHALTMSFFKEDGVWLVFESNDEEPKEVKQREIEKLIPYIDKAFSEGMIYCNSDQMDEFKKIMSSLESNQTWCNTCKIPVDDYQLMDDEKNPLILAAYHFENFELVKAIVENDPTSAYVRYDKDDMFLEALIKYNNVDLLKEILKYDVDLNIGYKPPLLDTAIRNGNVEIVKLLIDKGAKGSHESLYLAVRDNEPDIVSYLLKEKIDIHGGETVSRDELNEWIAPHKRKIFNEYCHDVIGKSIFITHFSPLHLAVLRNNSERVMQLLQAGYSPENKCVISPFMLAKLLRHDEIAELLVQKDKKFNNSRPL